METHQMDHPYFPKHCQYPDPSGDPGYSFGDITGVYDIHGPVLGDQDSTNFDVEGANMWPEYSYNARLSE